LAALGVGAVAGSFLLTQLRTRLSANRLLVGASLVYALVMAAIVLIPNVIVAVVALLPAGLAWIAVLSTMNASLQLFLPEWGRAGGLSVYLTVLFGSQGVGAGLWGGVGAPKGVLPAYLIAAAMMVGGAATVRIWPLIDTAGMDRRTVALCAPELAVEAAPERGPGVGK